MTKKPVLIRKTTRFFPDEESEATTAIQIANEVRITDPWPYCPFNAKEVLISGIFKKGFHTGPISKPWEKQMRSLWENC